MARSDATRSRPFPSVRGYLYSIVSDEKGGWFLSGNFTAVGGKPRYCLAHVLADGSVAPWNPNPNLVSGGTGGLLLSGNTVYVNGGFATISGKSRQYIAALDATTGEALDWDAHSNGLVAPLAIRGNTLYVGGYFTEIGGQPRNNIAALDATTGEATAWDPNADSGVSPIVLRDSVALVGGVFSHIGGQTRAGFAEISLTTGLATDWSPTSRPGYAGVYSMSLLGDQLYVGGVFDSLNGQPRHCLGAFDMRTKQLEAWDPEPNTARGVPEIDCVHAVGGSVYVSGFISSVGGKARNFVAELDPTTGVATDWNPDPANDVWCIATDDSLVYLGGWFQSIGMRVRHNLAAFNLKTGLVLDWNPSPDGLIIYALSVHDGRLYAAGDFSQIGGQPRSDLASLDLSTGLTTDWNPAADQVVSALLLDGNIAYVGGAFNHVGGQPRRYLAALDAHTGAATDWNPGPNDWVTALAKNGETVFAGGYFWQMGGQSHSYLAAIDAASGNALPWQLDTDGLVNTLATAGNVVYAGGEFDHALGGLNRLNLLSFSAVDGSLTDWAPSPNGPREDGYFASVDVLATRGNTVYVGGDFTLISGGHRASLAAVDGTTGALLDWAPEPDQSVHALDVTGDRLYAGGYFQAASLQNHLAVMGVTYPGAPSISPTPDTLLAGSSAVMAPIRPNPFSSHATIRYALPSAMSVSLAMYDLQGRRAENLVDRQVQLAGEHQLSMSATHLSAGCYFLRLDAGGVSRTQKVVVVR